MTIPSLDRVLDAVLRVDYNFNIKSTSDRGHTWFATVLGLPVPDQFTQLVHPGDLTRFKHSVASALDGKACDVRLLVNDREHWISVRSYPLTSAGQYVLCIIDISGWKTEGAAIRHAAEHDELTGLPNRALLQRTTEALIDGGAAPFSIAMLDLDGFKKVNDSYGHAIGDAVLVETTKRLLKIIGENDFLAHLGGDVFVLLFRGKNATESHAALRGALLAVARPYDAAPHNAYLGASIGVAQYPVHGEDYSTLMKNADTAMYLSKHAGRNRVTVFTPTQANVDFSIKAAIHNGIQEGEFYMEYQPQFDMQRRVVGAEALMRWNNRTMGRVGPDQFIPIVEDSGLMPFLGKWALRYACHQLQKIHQFAPHFVMSVNVSPVQFRSEDFDAQVLQAIEETGIDPTKLVLEITESTLMGSQERIERALVTLRERGIRFSIDDFGTGFSSLSYLTRLPVSSLKIDKAFVYSAGDGSTSQAANKRLVTAMIHLAHSIDLKVVAEGVETETQMAFLKAAGCNYIQGYLLGKPMSAVALSNVIITQSPMEAAA